jgi:LytTr DNA-binding domain
LVEKGNNQKSFNEEALRLFAISFGVFLFILFFQPFPLESLDYENRLLFVTGFGIITFVSSCLVFLTLPYFFPEFIKNEVLKIQAPVFLSLLMLLLSVTAYFFYIRYVGGIYLSLYIMFKAVLVCLLPLLIIIILYKNKSLQKAVDTLEKENQVYLLKINENEENKTENEIIITSENGLDKFQLKIKNLVYIRSSDNYIEIHYTENEGMRMKLIRSTLKGIDDQLIKINYIVRCHRTCIVNSNFIEKLVRNYSGYFIKVKNNDIKLPVSRQYISRIKDLT